MYFGRVSVKRQCIVTIVVIKRQQGIRRKAYKLVEIVEKPRNIDSPASLYSYFVFPSNCFDVPCMISPRDSKLTRDSLPLYIYIYIYKVSFYSIFFSLFSFLFSALLSYLIFVTDHILEPIKLALFTRRPIQFLFERSRQIAFDFFYSRFSREPRKIISQLSPKLAYRREMSG